MSIFIHWIDMIDGERQTTDGPFTSVQITGGYLRGADDEEIAKLGDNDLWYRGADAIGWSDFIMDTDEESAYEAVTEPTTVDGRPLSAVGCGRHEVFVTDDGIIPTCDLCSGPQYVEGDDWNGETGNHYSCERAAVTAEIADQRRRGAQPSVKQAAAKVRGEAYVPGVWE